jgi:hypothetical protein
MDFPDVLSVAPVATAEQEILLLANNGDAAANVVTNTFVKNNKSAVTIVGTKALVSDSELTALGASRLNGGINRFATNLIVNKFFGAALNKDIIYVAIGTNFPDALVGSAAAGITKSQLILIDTETSSTTTAIAYIKAIAPKTAVKIIGGEGVITPTTLNDINVAVNKEQIFFGKWVIKKLLAYGPAGTYTDDEIKAIIGKELTFSKENVTCFGEDASFLNKVAENPVYTISVISKSDYEESNRMTFDRLGIKSESITEIDARDTKWNGCTFYIKDTNTLILFGGGIYLELDRS